MQNKILQAVVFCSFLLWAFVAGAQPFAAEIAAFKKTDSLAYPFPGQHPLVFVGSSSFRKWENLQQDFPGYPVLNRGFGGSTLPDVIRYADDIILKYHPKQVIIYCGENDLATPEHIAAGTVFNRFKKLFRLIRKNDPAMPIAFVSIKPSPSRQNIQPAVIAANRMIKKFIGHKKNAAYIDVYTPMLNADGIMRKELFIADDLHMNEKGYQLWQKIIEPYLLR